eukprot:363873-Chlamydomonas_euryale.AAC.20
MLANDDGVPGKQPLCICASTTYVGSSKHRQETCIEGGNGEVVVRTAVGLKDVELRGSRRFRRATRDAGLHQDGIYLLTWFYRKEFGRKHLKRR